MTRGEMNWKIFRSIIPIIAMIFFVYYTKNLKTDYTQLDPFLKTDAHEAIWRFQMNEGQELLYKVIQINGKVTKVDSIEFILHHKIICLPYDKLNFNTSIGDEITIKGRCVNYNSITTELKLDHVVKVMN